jgi:PAP2 superfamily
MMTQLLSRSLGAALLAGVSCSATPTNAADPVLQWNEIAQRVVGSANAYIQSRSMAIMHLAILDAVTGATSTVAIGIGAATPPFSPDAAAISAAHDVIRTLHPESAASVEAALTAGLASILDGEPKVQGISLGRRAAAKMLERRKDDGWNATASYAPGSGPGIWVPTPPAHAPALLPHWGKVTPFALKTGDQFRPGAPADIDSPRYLKELREVFEVGATNSSRRPPELTDAARFWQISGVQGWNPAARQVSTAKQQTLLANTQTFALLNVAIADALIACFDAKYTYNTWRPVTAIRAGLGVIGPVADWLPAIVTPPFPAYPSGHACAAGAARDVLERIFGPDGHAIELTSATAPSVTFRYASFKAVADQVDDARVYGGIHIREDQEVGGELGRKVGRSVYETLSQGRR